MTSEKPAAIRTLEDRIAELEQRLADRSRTRRKVIALGAGVSLLVWAASALSQAVCADPNPALPAPLVKFCPGTPARASDVNQNLSQLVSWLQQKVGVVGTNNVSVGGNLAVTGSATVTGAVAVPSSNVSFGSQTRQMINLWSTNYGIGVQNSTQYFRADSYFAWFTGGTHNDNAINPGAGGTRQMYLDNTGTLFTLGAKRTDTGGLSTYEVSTRRYVREASPSVVGTVQALDQGIVEALCRDDDGCGFTIAMVNWDAAQAGNVSSRSGRLFLSQTSSWWRLEISANDFSGNDSDGTGQEYSAWDCYFTDSQTATSAMNNRSDNGTGFGLLNCAGCNYSDATTVCRVILTD